mmetsp:Transcript_23541/g.93308  ORF Transcript_23541/g.93308 Transcript_23541/m.93308 type:complete len:183 (+) Transcript_23541:675-1223(+)
MVERLFEYMISWDQSVAVCVGVKLFTPQETGDSFVAIAVVLRRDDDGKPKLDRIFNVGTRDADSDAVTDLLSWIEQKVRDGEMAKESDRPTVVARLPVEEGEVPAPHSLPVAVPVNLRHYYTVFVSAPELYYRVELTDEQKARVHELPPLEINLYQMRVVWNALDRDWNTAKAQKEKRRRVH